jgi:hypothetical protein
LVGCGSGPEFEAPKPSSTRKVASADLPYYDRVNDVGFAVLSGMENDPLVAIAPVPLAHSLAVLMNGSSGKTRDELLALFGLTESNRDAFNSAQRALLNKFDSEGDYLSRPAVFAVWPVIMDKKFVETMGSQYGADVRKLGGATIEGQRLLDTWAEEATNGAIDQMRVGLSKEQQLLTASVASLDTSYEYAIGFGPFPIGKYEDGDVFAVRYGLVAKGLSLVFIRPKGGASLETLVAGLNGARFRQILDGMVESIDEIHPPTIHVSGMNDLSMQVRDAGAGSLFGAECNLRPMSIELEHGFAVSAMPHAVSFSVAFNESKKPSFGRATSGTVRRIGYPNVFAVVDDATGALCVLGTMSQIR